jgi:hypothetical protein
LPLFLFAAIVGVDTGYFMGIIISLLRALLFSGQ